jgi:putative oxidoreductase
MRTALTVFARICLALIFLLSGISKFTGTAGFAGYLASKHVPAPTPAALVAAFIEVVGGILLIIGFQAQITAIILALYLIPTTYIGHVLGGAQQIEIMKNISIFGGLLLVAVHGAGEGSLDAARSRSSATLSAR